MSGSEEKPTEPPGEEDSGFLQRWSRRKQAAARNAPARPEAAETEDQEPARSSEAAPKAQAQAEAETQAEVEQEPPGDDAMPPLESIDQGGGVEAFFSSKVSAGLRRAALRRLFSQPEFGGPDLLEEYAGDYSKPTPLGDIVTVEMRYRTEQARKLAERKLKAAMESESRPETRPAPVQAPEVKPAKTEVAADAQLESEAADSRDVDASEKLAREDASTSNTPSSEKTDQEVNEAKRPGPSFPDMSE